MNFDFKHATTDYPVLDIIRHRWSPRAFADTPVEPEKLLSCLEAARWAPSSSNVQPWTFIIVSREDADAFQRAVDCLREGNQIWAQHAPLLLFTVAQLQSDSGRSLGFRLHDVGQAVAYFSLQATALGLHLHQMAGIYPDKVRETFHIPETHEPATAIALGYLGDPDTLSEEHRARELQDRTRKLLGDFVFADDWQKPFPV